MIPPFCPDPRCRHHNDDAKDYQHFWKHAGSYDTLVAGTVRRYQCLACGKGFSERTFSLAYYTKKRLDFREVHRSISQGESLSSIARHLCCSIDSVQNRIDRLARAGISAHARIMQGVELGEHLVADGFESFDRSQFFPCNINLLNGKDSQFLYGATHVTIRRKGRMTSRQKILRSRLELCWKPARGVLVTAFTQLMTIIPRIWDPRTVYGIELWTDENPAYPMAITRVPALRKALADNGFIHKTYSSKLPRTKQNPLFSVNYYDRELRKDIAAFRRESTCFSRNVSNGLMRFMLHMVYHNYQKCFRVHNPLTMFSHAEAAGIPKYRLKEELAGLYLDRPFVSKVNLNPEERRIWLKDAPTPLKTTHDYVPKYAKVS